MTTSEPPEPDRGEGRLLDYLEELRENPPATDAAIVRRASRGARWQYAVRAPLLFVGQVAGALADGVLALLAPDRRSER